MQTQTSNTLHNAIMEAGGKDRPPMLAPDKEVPISKGSSVTTTKMYMENYKNVLQDIRDQLNAEAEAVQIILTRIDNDIYSTVNACPNACEMWKAIERGKSIVNSPPPIYDHEPSMVAEDDEMSKDKEIDKLMALISLSGVGYDNQRLGNVDGARETVEDQELEAHYMYMAQIQAVSLDAADSGPIFDSKPVQKVSTDDHYNVFAIESEHPEQSESVHDTYPIIQDEHNMIIDSLDMSYDREQIDRNDDDDDLANERELLASLIEKLKCEIDDSKNRNNFLETSNKVLIEQLKEINALMYKDLKKFQAELYRRNDVEYASKVEIDYAKGKGDLISYKMESQKSLNKYTQQINDLNQKILEIKKKLSTHQETISILSQTKEAQIKLYKTREDKELDKVSALENKIKVLDNIVYKTGQSVQTINMLNNKCQTRFIKPEFLKKAQRANPRLYDIGVISITSVSRPQLKSNPMEDRVLPNNTQGKKQEVEDHHRNVKFSKNKTCLTACNDSLKAKTLNVNFVCATCGVPLCQKLHCTLILLQLMEIVLLIVDSGCSKHMTGNLKLLINFMEKFLGMVKFGNDQIAPILGYEDLGNNLLTGSRGTDFYSITLQDTTSPNPIYLMAKVTSSQAWLWHRRLSHLNFDTINLLSKNDIVVGLPKLKFVKDQLCSSCELGKAKRKSFQSKTTPSSKRRLQLIHMDLCGPIRVASINGNKYVLVIVDDYSRYTWTHFLRSKDETPKVLIDFLRLVQRGLHA
nr:hypothetical protein [Tanacetum cinerariifolium]